MSCMKNFLKISKGSAPSAPGKLLVAQVNRQYANRVLKHNYLYSSRLFSYHVVTQFHLQFVQ